MLGEYFIERNELIMLIINFMANSVSGQDDVVIGSREGKMTLS